MGNSVLASLLVLCVKVVVHVITIELGQGLKDKIPWVKKISFRFYFILFRFLEVGLLL